MRNSEINLVERELNPVRIGMRLRMLRLAVGKSKKEMAEALDMPIAYWGRFEAGQRVITHQFAARIYAHFGATLDYIYLGRENTLPLELAARLHEVGQSKA